MTNISELKALYPDELSAGEMEYTQVNIPYRSVDAMKQEMKMKFIGVGVAKDVPPYAAAKLSERISKITKDLSPLIMAQRNCGRYKRD